MFRVVRVRRRRRRQASALSIAQYEKYKEVARALVLERISHFALLLGVSIKKVAIKNSRTRWGSCSSKGNLNFNYRLVLIEPALVDYVVAHELCHLKHFNHGPQFWAEVERVVPNWQVLRKRLRAIKL